MNGERPQRDIRVLRNKQVADVLKDVLQDKTDVGEIETALHRVSSRYHKASFAEREVFDQLLISNLSLAKAVGQLARENMVMKERISALETAHRD